MSDQNVNLDRIGGVKQSGDQVVDTSNHALRVNVVAGSGSGSNAAAGPTGSNVPVDAGYTGVSVGGTLQGVTGLSLTNAVPMDVAIVDGSGNQITSFGGGTQYADGASQTTPTGTAALGKNPSNVLHALALDGSGNLNVNVQAIPTTTVQQSSGSNLHVNVDNYPSSQAVTGTVGITGNVGVTQQTTPWVVSTGGTVDALGNQNVNVVNQLAVGLAAPDGSDIVNVTDSALDVHIKPDDTIQVVNAAGPLNVQVANQTYPADIAPSSQSITVQDTTSVQTSGFDTQSIVTGVPVLGSAAVFSFAGMSSIRCQISGVWTGTLQFEASIDGGVTWYLASGHLPGTPYVISSCSSNCMVTIAATASTNFRVRATAAMTGTATITVVETPTVHVIDVLNPLSIIGSGVTATVKAPGVVATSADPSLVVAINPNTPITGTVAVSSLPNPGPVQLVANNPADAFLASLADTDGNLVAVTDNALDVHIKPDDAIKIADSMGESILTTANALNVQVQNPLLTVATSSTVLAPNAAQEAGGNLALIAAIDQLNQNVMQLQQQNLDILRQINVTLNAILLTMQHAYGTSVDRDDVMNAEMAIQ